MPEFAASRSPRRYDLNVDVSVQSCQYPMRYWLCLANVTYAQLLSIKNHHNQITCNSKLLSTSRKKGGKYSSVPIQIHRVSPTAPMSSSCLASTGAQWRHQRPSHQPLILVRCPSSANAWHLTSSPPSSPFLVHVQLPNRWWSCIRPSCPGSLILLIRRDSEFRPPARLPPSCHLRFRHHP